MGENIKKSFVNKFLFKKYSRRLLQLTCMHQPPATSTFCQYCCTYYVQCAPVNVRSINNNICAQ